MFPPLARSRLDKAPRELVNPTNNKHWDDVGMAGKAEQAQGEFHPGTARGFHSRIWDFLELEQDRDPAGWDMI